jgi:hypothetical protein
VKNWPLKQGTVQCIASQQDGPGLHSALLYSTSILYSTPYFTLLYSTRLYSTLLYSTLHMYSTLPTLPLGPGHPNVLFVSTFFVSTSIFFCQTGRRRMRQGRKSTPVSAMHVCTVCIQALCALCALCACIHCVVQPMQCRLVLGNQCSNMHRPA